MRIWNAPTSSTGSVPRLVLPCDPAVAGDRARIAQVASAFRAAHPGGQIVSVAPDTDELRMLRLDIASARELLPYASFLALWTKAYRLADALKRCAGPDLTEVIGPFYHSTADLALQALLVPAALQMVPGPLLVLAPPGAASLYQDLPVEVLPTPWALRRLRIGDIQLLRLFRVGRDLAREWRRRFSPRASGPAAADRPAGTLPAILVVAEDGVSGVNFPSALAVVTELQAVGRAVVVLTSNPQVRDTFEAKGAAVRFCGVPELKSLRLAMFARWRRAARDLRRLRQDAASSREERAHAHLVAARLLPFCVFGAQIEALLSRYHNESAPIGAGLVVNEGISTAVATLAWLKARGLPDVGYWPALLGGRPDCEFFPATRHLIYGDHLRDMMLAIGIDAESIETVGSVNFDQALGRNAERDRAYVDDQLLAGRPRRRKLVIVATEALPSPFDEIAPVLDALVAVPDVEIVLKLHPADSAKLYRDYLAEHGLGERVVLLERCDLDALLGAATLLVCVLSNIIVRAAMLGTPTLVCDFGDKRAPLDFVAAGLAVGCFSPGQVAPLLGDLLGDGPARHAVVAQLGRAVLRFCHATDGKSAKRVAASMLSLLPPPTACA
jgi:hypothetical protein